MNRVNALLSPETTKNCHAKLMTTGNVKDMKKSGCASTSRSEENLRTIQEMFTCSPKKKPDKRICITEICQLHTG